MTRNLIEAEAWAGSRAQVCSQCSYFGTSSHKIDGYGWNNCQRQTAAADAEDPFKWDG
ncbi:MAG: hypothetical protein ACYSTG_04140 [Planctomycetota bacterium]